MKWFVALDVLYACRLDEIDVRHWEEFLQEHGPTNNDLCESIRMARFEGMKPDEWKVTAPDLIRWLGIFRKRRSAAENKAERVARIQAFILEWQEKLSRGCPHADFYTALDQLQTEQGFNVSTFNDISREVMPPANPTQAKGNQ